MPTVQDILYDARALLDELNDDGVIISSDDDDIKALEVNGLRYINMGIQEIFRNTKDFGEYKITQKSVPNLIGGGFQVLDFIGDDQYYPNEGGIVGAKSYTFTVSDDFTVYIQEHNGTMWSTLETITASVTEETTYKGLITPGSSSYPIRMVMSGTTFYRHKNRALFAYPFKLSQIPTYNQWVRYEMPNNYGEFKEIVREYQDTYTPGTTFKWEGRKTLAIRYDYDGSIKIIYNKIPVKLTQSTDEILIYNPSALQFLTFFVAAKMAPSENDNLTSFFEQKANEMKFDALKEEPAEEVDIEDTFRDPYYGYGGGYGYL